jgi:CubicO group peptidase (beta-lactamase class C family)
VLATTTLAMRQASGGLLALDTPTRSRLPGFRGPDRDRVTVADLLEHAAGLPSHRPYYRRTSGRAGYELAIAREPLSYAPRTRHQYSDLGFMLLGFLLEDAEGRSLDDQFTAFVDTILDGVDLRFGVPGGGRGDTAPTEADPWRGQVLTGLVHDPNAAALGGAAGHAGLFGTAEAVGCFARWLMRLWRGEEPRAFGISPGTLRRFVTRGHVPASSRALGWDTMLPTSSCGAHFSKDSIGHTGFTGTSIWIDPVQDLYVLLLTNRVHPSGPGSPDAIRGLRVAVHDAIAAGMV